MAALVAICLASLSACGPAARGTDFSSEQAIQIWKDERMVGSDMNIVKWMTDSPGLSVAFRVVTLLAGLFLLAGTWLLLFHLSSLWTKGVLVPWDIAIEVPPVGSWERNLNDFFSVSPGKSIPSAVLLSISAGLFLLRAWRSSSRALLALGFALANFLACLLSYPAFMLGLVGVVAGAHWLGSSGAGFHNSVLPGAVMTVLFAGLLLVQAKVPFEDWLSGSHGLDGAEDSPGDRLARADKELLATPPSRS